MDQQALDALLDSERWADARAMIRAELRHSPRDHWLLTRLALTYYEQRNYRNALRHSEQALAIDPKCPLVLWDYAGALQLLDRHEEAIAVYAGLAKRGHRRIARDSCSEGLAWSRGLVADCFLRISDSLDDLGRSDDSHEMFAAHLDLRGPGCRSIYKLDELGKKHGTRQKRPRGRKGRAA